MSPVDRTRIRTALLSHADRLDAMRSTSKALLSWARDEAREYRDLAERYAPDSARQAAGS